MLLTAPHIESTPQEEIDNIVRRTLDPATGGGDPPKIRGNGRGGGDDEPDDADDKKPNNKKGDFDLLYIAVLAMVLGGTAVVLISNFFATLSSTKKFPTYLPQNSTTKRSLLEPLLEP